MLTRRFDLRRAQVAPPLVPIGLQLLKALAVRFHIWIKPVVFFRQKGMRPAGGSHEGDAPRALA